PGSGAVAGAAPGSGAVAGAAPGSGAVAGAAPGSGAVAGAAPGSGAVAGAAPGSGAGSGVPLAEQPSFVLITVDSLRADRLSAYGYSRQTSPHFDERARQGVLFVEARAQGPMTRFSLPSLLSGRYFTELKRTGGAWPRIAEENRLLGTRMSELGYYTATISALFYFRRFFGLVHGFQVVDLGPAYHYPDFHQHPTGDLVTDAAIRLLPRLPTDRPFFLWLHYMDPHSDYVRHRGLPQFGLQRKDLYDGEVLYSDLQIHRFLQALAAARPRERLVIVVTSDHGEGLDHKEDHGKLFHGQHLFDNLIRVPLLVVGPGFAPRRIEAPVVVGLIDLLPTFLELAGAPADPTLAGRSLVPLLRGAAIADGPSLPVFSEKDTVLEPSLKSMIVWPYKLIWNLGLNRYMLYDLSADPLEQQDLLGRNEQLDRTLIEAFKQWRSDRLKEVPTREKL
ncbi:MAG: sulfatase, partial [Deltaproteobacteria bacterium]|nr:sulfatase [Deltaproteobacteria bacterium]